MAKLRCLVNIARWQDDAAEDIILIVTLAVPISVEAQHRLAEKAKAAGLDLPTFVARLLEAEAKRPTLSELSGKVFENFNRTGMSESELVDRLESEKHAAREARRGSPFLE
jgi:hypothetical protein